MRNTIEGKNNLCSVAWTLPCLNKHSPEQWNVWIHLIHRLLFQLKFLLLHLVDDILTLLNYNSLLLNFYLESQCCLFQNSSKTCHQSGLTLASSALSGSDDCCVKVKTFLRATRTTTTAATTTSTTQQQQQQRQQQQQNYSHSFEDHFK